MNIEITGEGDYLISPKLDEVIKNFTVTTENGKTTFSVTGEDTKAATSSDEKVSEPVAAVEAPAPKTVAPETFAQEEKVQNPRCADCRQPEQRTEYREPEQRTEYREPEQRTEYREPVYRQPERKVEYREPEYRTEYREPEYRQEQRYAEPERKVEYREPERCQETKCAETSTTADQKCMQCVGNCGIAKEIFRWFSAGAAMALGAVAVVFVALKKKD